MAGDNKLESIYPLTPMQQGMLFHTLLHPDSGAYFVQLHWLLEGPLDAGVLHRAWQAVVDHHPILRTAFAWDRKDRPLQAVLARAEVPWSEQDWSTLGASAQEQRLRELLEEDQRRGFDLKRAPLLRLVLVRLGEQRHRLLWSVHHLLLDGWSTARVLGDVLSAYAALARGQTPRLQPCRPFRDFVSWLGTQDASAAESFWRERLRGYPGAVPLELPRPIDGSGAGAPGQGGPTHEEARRELSAELSEAIRALARRERLTESVILLGAFCVVLSRYADRRELAVGVTVSGRPPGLEGAERMVGLFINTLPVSVEVEDTAPVSAWLARQQERMASLQAWSSTPLPELRRHAGLAADQPLFEQLFVFENYPDTGEEPPQLGGMRVGEVSSVEQPDYPLTLVAAPGARLVLRTLFDARRYTRSSMERLLGHLENVLRGMVAAPQGRLESLDLLGREEEDHLLGALRGERRPYPADASLVEQVEAQVARAPEALVLLHGEQRLTYRELDERAERLHHRLRARGVGPGQQVAILLERGADFLAAMLGVLKSGAAYTPLDRAQPAERLAFMLADSGARVLLTSGPPALVPPEGCEVLEVTEALADAPGERAPRARADGGSVAYVMYTSGSTGRPKGIAVPHRAVSRLVLNNRFLSLDPGARVAFASNVSFDAATLEIWGALLHGGCLVVIEREVLLSSTALAAFLRESPVDLLWLTAGVFHQVARQAPEAFAPVQCLICGGDVVDPHAVRAVQAAGGPRHLLNGYGPTENTTFTATHDTAGLGPTSPTVPIGQPISNTEVLVLDRRMRPQPLGVAGELYTGGEGLALGYHARPELTAERFVPHPWAQRPGERLYRTGDMVRWLEDGTLEFLGRGDQQVKLRGFRIELGEVEAVLHRHPGVEQALVMAHDFAPGDRRLVAYVVGSGLPPPQELRAWAAQHLPDYMVPAAVKVLDALPLTANGKVDRRALPAPQEVADTATGTLALAGRSPTVQVLAGIWSQVLQVPSVEPGDSFFELGGHSLLATVVLSRLRAAFGVELPLSALFEAPTLRELAARIEAERRGTSGARTMEPVSREGPLPLSFAQQRLWFLDRYAPLSAAYHIPHALHLRGDLDVEALTWCLGEIVRRHEVLRTVLPEVEGRPRQQVLAWSPLELPEVDLAALPEVERREQLRRHLQQQFESRFDLARGPLMRVLLLRLGPSEHVLAITLHHIVADGWSVGLLARELRLLYAARKEGRESPLPELTVQYADFSAWQRRWLQGAVLERQLAYWRKQLEALPATELATDRPRPATQSFRGAVLEVELPEPLSQALLQLARKEDSTPFMVLLTGFFTLLHRYTGQQDLVVGSPVANRNHVEVEPLIGFFVNMLAMRARIEGEPGFTKLLAQVRRAALEAYDHQDVPFEMLVETLRPTRDPSRQPLFQVTFAVHNVPAEDVELPGVTLDSVRTDLDWVRFDLELHLWQHPRGLRGYWAYATSLFDAATIERLHRHYVNLLTAAVARPERSIASLELLDAEERQRLLVEWNATAARYPSEQSLHHLVDARAMEHPERPAVLLDGARLDFGELKRRSDQLAHRLVRHGVGPETRVALLVERSLEMVVALVAVLKAGAAYVPLDPTYPRARLEYLVREAAPTLLLSHRRLAEGLKVEAPVLDLETLEEPERGGPEGAPERPFHPAQGAYVIFTSGSTGLPKGVVVSHQALLNHMTWMQARFPLSPEDRVLQKTTFTFDASVWEFWAPLLAGAPVVLARPGLHADPRYLVQALREQRITVLQMVPSVLDLLVATPGLEECRALRRVFIGGEALTWPLVRRLRERVDVEVVNLYGPAEATIDATFSIWTREAEGGPCPIGRPISNLRAYVLDRHLEPLPVGVPGELYLGGEGLARGYLRQPAFTAERFLPDPRATPPGSRLYRTGDLARWLPDGQLEYLGRIDHQVKIRGQRVELGEVEAQLQSLEEVRDAVVTLFEEEGQARLVAYVVPSAVGRDEDRERRATARVTQWQTFYEELYRHAPAEDPTFDITGWNSSYTGAPLPAADMRRWLDTTLERIFQLSPRRVLEVGCGTGLILFSVAPRTERYHALDFSSSVISRLRALVAERGLGQVELEQRAAHDLGHLPPGAFDTVVLNSVIQYFPSAEYLLKVLEQAIAATAPGGALFVGDVRSLPLLDAYHASVQLHQAGREVGREELAQRIESQRRREEELVVDPALFSALRARLPRVRDVTVRVKRGGADNELMRYRYDVVLHLDQPRPRPTLAPRRLDGQAAGTTVEAVGRLLAESHLPAVRVERLENARVSRELRLLTALRQPGETASLPELLERIDARPSRAPDPEAWWQLGAEQGYQVEVGPSEHGEVGELDVLLLAPEALVPASDAPAEVAASEVALSRLASDPLPNRWSRSLAPELRERLVERLPAYMVPQTILCLESLPLTANGKVDRGALPRPDREGLVNRETYVRPSTETERRLAQVWRGLLELKRVGVRDDFFALGGHSLLVVMLAAAIRQELGVELAVPQLFQLTTIEAQARFVEEARREGPRASEGIVTLLNGSSGPRVFCFPPLMGYGLAFLGLSQQVPGYGFCAFDFPENEPDPLERYAAAVSELQPEGPLLFCGYSAGGPVALEVARLLQRRGRQVSDLILLDAAIVEHRQVLSEAELDALVADNLDYFEAFILRDPLLRKRFTGTETRAAMAAKMRAYVRFLDRLEHRGDAVPVNVHLIQAADAGEGRLSWDAWVSGQVRVYQGQGRHVDMVHEDHVGANAALMADILAGLVRADPAGGPVRP